MSQFIPQLMSCPCATEAEDKDVLHHLLSSAIAAEGGINRGDSGLEVKNVQPFVPIFSRMTSKLSAFLSQS